MTMLSKRLINLAGLLACAGMMAFALYVEHQLFVEPCPLCVFQRMAVIGIGIAFLLLVAHNPSPGWALVSTWLSWECLRSAELSLLAGTYGCST